jgi:hypothetical protein
MIKKELLKTLIRDFHLREIPVLKPRLLDIPLHLNKVASNDNDLLNRASTTLSPRTPRCLSVAEGSFSR